jgi:hypothetical protein
LMNFPWASSLPWNVAIISAMTVSFSFSNIYITIFRPKFIKNYFASIQAFSYISRILHFTCTIQLPCTSMTNPAHKFRSINSSEVSKHNTT